MDGMKNNIQNTVNFVFFLARYCYTATLLLSETLSLPFSIERLLGELKCHDEKGVLSLVNRGVKPNLPSPIYCKHGLSIVYTFPAENNELVSRALID